MSTRSSILAEIVLGQRSPVGYRLWGRKELDMTELLSTQPEKKCTFLSVSAFGGEDLGLRQRQKGEL